jgi:hypothetical protein
MIQVRVFTAATMLQKLHHTLEFSSLFATGIETILSDVIVYIFKWWHSY